MLSDIVHCTGGATFPLEDFVGLQEHIIGGRGVGGVAKWPVRICYYLLCHVLYRLVPYDWNMQWENNHFSNLLQFR